MGSLLFLRGSSLDMLPSLTLWAEQTDTKLTVSSSSVCSVHGEMQRVVCLRESRRDIDEIRLQINLHKKNECLVNRSNNARLRQEAAHLYLALPSF